MAFPGFNFYGSDWDLDTYGGKDGGFSLFGGAPPDWQPDLSGVPLPPQPQRRPLSVDDLYQPAPAMQEIEMPAPVGGVGDLTDEQRKQLRNDLILQVGMAFAQGSQNRGAGLAGALGEAAQNVQGGREQMLAMEEERRRGEYEQRVREALAQREAAQAEAESAKQRQLANSLSGMANKVAEAEPALADLADTYARMGQMDDLVGLYQKLPDYAAAREAGFDPFAQPNWREIVAERERQAQEEAEKAAEREAEFEEWKRQKELERIMGREDLRWRQSQGLLFAPPGPKEPPRPRYNLEVRDGWTYRVDLDTGQATKLEGVPRQPPRTEESQSRAPRIIEEHDSLGRSTGKFYEIIDPITGKIRLEPIPFPKKPKQQSRLDAPREAPTSGGDVRSAADRGEGGRPQKAPTAEQVEKKLALVSQSYGPLTKDQEEFVRQELQKGMTAQSILARIRRAMQGGSRA